MNKREYNKHGLTNHKLYAVWKQIKQKCNNPNSYRYKYYGKRGITICAEWTNSFIVFYNWCLNNSWKSGLSIDRTNNDLGYYPENCRFVNQSIQNSNKRGYGITGVKHVSKRRGGYIVKKQINGRHVYFGDFKTLEEAAKVAKEIDNV